MLPSVQFLGASVRALSFFHCGVGTLAYRCVSRCESASLLASDNLAAFAAHHRVTYRIFTSRRDAFSIMASPAFQRAREIVPFELIEYPVEDTDNPIGMHHFLWRRSIMEARQAGAMILFVPPDVAWSNGSFRHLSDVALQGKKAIFITDVRVVSETCIPELRRRHLSQDGAVLTRSHAAWSSWRSSTSTRLH